MIIHISHPLKAFIKNGVVGWVESLESLRMSSPSSSPPPSRGADDLHHLEVQPSTELCSHKLGVSHHHPPHPRKNASPRRCRHGNTGPTHAAAPGPPGTLAFRGPERGNWEPHGDSTVQLGQPGAESRSRLEGRQDGSRGDRRGCSCRRTEVTLESTDSNEGRR